MGKTIILTGGGTAGHVTPNIALIPLLQKDGWTIHYIGSHTGIEKELIAQYPDVTYHSISSGKLRRHRARGCGDPLHRHLRRQLPGVSGGCRQAVWPGAYRPGRPAAADALPPPLSGRRGHASERR